MTEKEFDDKLVETLDNFLLSMAESPEVEVEKFYNMTCLLENLRFFSPVLYSAIRNKEA
ncbi:hypothetical protein [Rufibacter immobilis]|nr:hypothetical protein [Rufibacter immobilis]